MQISEIIALITTFLLLLLALVLSTSKRSNRQSNLILASFMFFNAFLVSWFAFSHFINYRKLGVPFSYFFLAPILFFYVKSLCQPKKLDLGRIRIYSLHFLPGILALLYSLVVLFTRKVSVDSSPGTQAWQHGEYLISNVLLHVQIWVYIILIFRMIYRYRIMIRDQFSSLRKIDLKWLLFIILAFILMWLIDLTSFILGEVTDIGRFWNILLVILSLTINLIFATAIVYRGLQHPDISGWPEEQEKYSHSALTSEEGNHYAAKLSQMMEETKPYLNPDLTIRELAENLGIHSKYLSQVINSRFRQNFFDFINTYRINEARRIMDSSASERKTIQEILYAVGYNSKSAFNASFKKATGLTPTQYRKASPRLG